MNEKLKGFFDFILRNAVWLILGSVALYLMKPQFAEVQTLLFIITIEALALALSGIAIFVYTKIPFIKLIMTGDDDKMNSVERHAVMAVLGHIFIGVHMLVGLIVLGVYIAQFAN